MSLTLPHIIGFYRLTQRIALGGMAEIFLATDCSGGDFSGQLVVKRLHRHLVDSGNALKRFENEAAILRKIDHSAFVKLVDSGVDEGIPYLVFEHVEGQSLEHLDGATFDQVIEIGAALCEALEYLHTHAAVAHCDISPHNLMLTPEGELKVMDLGIAQTLGVAPSDGELHANLAYMSPEQARQQKLSVRSDLFSVGVLLWELLTGTPLFAGQNDFETINNILEAAVENPCSVNPLLPPEYGELVLTFLARDAGDRPESCGLAGQELRALLTTAKKDSGVDTNQRPYRLVLGIVLVVAVLAGYLFLRS
jgi:serine/threonine-protein kinase